MNTATYRKQTISRLSSFSSRSAGLKTGIFGLYIFSFMFYFFDSGGVQVSNFIFGAVFIIVYKEIRLFVSLDRKLINSFVMLFVYIALVNIVNWVFDGDSKHASVPFYYFYNFTVFLASSYFYSFHRAKIPRVFALSLMGALVVQLAILVSGFGQSFRGEGTFNNPNQLGYWSLLVLIVYASSRVSSKISLADILVIALCVLCTAFSLSKAALVSIVIAALIFLSFRLKVRNLVMGVLVIPLIIVFLFDNLIYPLIGDVISDVIRNVELRMSTFGQSDDDNLEGRNYDRIWRFPEYLLFGAGEGGYSRFTQGYKSNEIHSTLGTIIFSYGIFGSLLFANFITRIISEAKFELLLYFIPLMAYGVTHQGLRSSLFWVFLGFVFASSKLSIIQRRRAS